MSLPSNEEWRPIQGFEGTYEVSSQGRVRTLHKRFRAPRILATYLGTSGYLTVDLYPGDRAPRTKVMIHRLVAQAFHGDPAPGQDVCRHLNGDRADNRPENLAWGTQKENNHDILRHGRNHFKNRTHCPAGHSYAEDGTVYVKRNGRERRACLACHRISSRIGWAKSASSRCAGSGQKPLRGGLNDRGRCSVCNRIEIVRRDGTTGIHP